MARRIIEEGPQEFHCRCFKCRSLFAYQLEDIRYYGSKMICPKCGEENYHPDQRKAINPRCGA